jgi:hypothetical protein
LRLEQLGQGERRKTVTDCWWILGAVAVEVANVAAIVRGPAAAKPGGAGRGAPCRVGRP